MNKILSVCSYIGLQMACNLINAYNYFFGYADMIRAGGTVLLHLAVCGPFQRKLCKVPEDNVLSHQ